MKAKEIADLTTAEVKEKIDIEVENYSKMRMNHAVSAFENPIQLRFKRKEIARLKTELRKRELTK
jgi:large subunit ribosomal protein L29